MMTPIYHQFASEIETKIKDECIEVARKYRIEVNEEGLIQALTNSRKFYDDGYADGQRDAERRLVRCEDCRRRYDADECPMCFLIDGEYHEYTNGNGFCDRGERRDTDA